MNDLLADVAPMQLCQLWQLRQLLPPRPLQLKIQLLARHKLSWTGFKPVTLSQLTQGGQRSGAFIHRFIVYVLSNYAVSFGFFPSSIIKACKWELTIAALGFEPASAWFATATKLWYWCSYLSGCISEFFRKMRTISKIYLPLLIR